MISASLNKVQQVCKAFVARIDLATWLFLCAVAIYLVTRLIGISEFPIYFFSDEAIQTLSAYDLINNGYRSSGGELLPTYFRNGEYYNIGLSVYLQILPVLWFGKSAIATRAASVVVTLIAAISVGILLRDVFKIKYWWTGTLFLSITPSWFLHSRTAFETAEFVAFYAGSLCAYLLYRYKSAGYLYLTVFLGALAFYTYAAAQLTVPLTALGLVISDWRYHWEHRKHILPAVALVAVLAAPYWRFRLSDSDAPLQHLHTLFSYWTEDLPLSEKISRYASEYVIGLSPSFWYVPNQHDLPRHLMKGYGHILLATLPLAILGLAQVLRNLQHAAYRSILIAALVSPAAGAVVATSITRALPFVFLAAILTSLGLEQALRWIESRREGLTEGRQQPGSSSGPIAIALLIVAIGIAAATLCEALVDRLAVTGIAIVLALQVSGVSQRYVAALSTRLVPASSPPHSIDRRRPILAISVFLILATANVYMLRDSLRNGPLWYQDYGLGGMQYGAFQMFDLLEQYRRDHPGTHVIFSPDWANGTNELARFFLGDSSQIEIASVRGHIAEKLPLDDNTLFVITPGEFNLLATAGKFKEINVVTIVPYPNGEPGFYFVKLRYVDQVDEIFAAERAARMVMKQATFTIDGEPVLVKYPYLDAEFQEESMALVFDGDPYTLAKTYKQNPFVMELAFPRPRTINGFSIFIGSANVEIVLRCQAAPGAEPVIYTLQGQGTVEDQELSFELPEPTEAEILHVEVHEIGSAEDAFVHIWELILR